MNALPDDNWGSAKQWADLAKTLGIDPKVMPHSKRNVNDKAVRDGWPFKERKGSGGGRVYHISVLPEAFRNAILDHLSHQAPAPPAPVAPAGNLPGPTRPAGAPLPQGRAEIVGDTTGLTDAQRATMDACCAILAWVERLAPAAGGITAARLRAEKMAKEGRLPPEIAVLAPIANAKAGKSGDRTLSYRSLVRWHSKRAAAGGQAVALAPKVPQPDMGIPPWAPALLRIHRTPQKRSLKEVVEEDLAEPGALPPGVMPPSYHQAKRWLAKVCSVEKQRGRMGPKELRSIRPFISRTTENLWPLDVVQADGHCLDSEVEHPRHHRAFKPELTTIIDLATRMIVGWSAGLAENALAVSDAIIYMAVRHGVPAVWYVDNGSGYNNQLMDAANTGLLHRLGVEKLNREADNPQAGGYVERSHQTLWIAGAKKLPTYLGRDMDRQASQKIHKITRKELKEFGRSRLLMPWVEFLAWAEELVRKYNEKPHSALPKITDPETGRRRHMKPVEAWAKAAADGWEPVSLSAAEAADMTRPHEERIVRRGTVEVLGNTYEAAELEPWHGESVQVAYDVADASKVWIKDMDGRLLCIAPFKPKRDVVPRSYLERAYDKRAKGREQRILNKLDEVRAERDPRFLDAQATVVLPDNVTALHDRLVIELTADPAPATTPTPIPETGTGRYDRWRALDARIAAGDPVSDDDRTWHQRYPLCSEWRAQDQMHRDFNEEGANPAEPGVQANAGRGPRAG